MGSKAQTILGLFVALLLIGGGGYYIYRDQGESPELPLSQGSGEVATSPENVGEVVTPAVTLVGGGASVTPTIPAPDLHRTLTFSVDFPKEARELMWEKITLLQEKLQTDPTDFAAWMDLGIRYKQVGDYEGAKDAWVYAGALQPGNNISFLNLGILYHYYLKDFPNAEENFLHSINNNTNYPQTYGELHALYRYSYKQDTTRAVDILKEGLKQNPEQVNLLMTLAGYYKDRGDTKNARTYYLQAKSAAQKNEDTKLATAIDEILALLPQ